MYLTRMKKRHVHHTANQEEEKGVTGGMRTRTRDWGASAFAVIAVGAVLAGTAQAAASAGPSITSFKPTSGSVGAGVAITGKSLTGASAVAFGGVAATYKVKSGTAITATVPSGAKTGKITVTTKAGTATSSSSYTVTPCTDPGTVSAFAASGSSTVPGGQSVASAGQTQVYVQFLYTAACPMAGGELQITVPSGWSAPATTTGVGCTTATGGSLVTSGQTITVSNLNMQEGGKLAVVYGQLASYGSATGAQTCAFGDGATASTTAGASVFTTAASLGTGESLTPLSASPTITVP
jgi:hypothetical protein